MNDHFRDEKSAVCYLINEGVFDVPHCPKCGDTMVNRNEKKAKEYSYRVHKKVTRSITKNTFFRNSHLPIHIMLTVCYYWLVKASYKTVKTITGLASQTITNTLRDCSEGDVSKYWRSR